MKGRILSIAIIIATTAIALLRLVNGPENIVLHWNASGEADCYGPKFLILMLPVVSSALFLLILQLEKHPYETSLSGGQNRQGLRLKAIRTITPILLLIILYVTACSANLLTISALVPFSLVVLAVIVYTYMSNKMTKR